MPSVPSIESMSVEEKVALMEALWGDLIRRDDYASPAWHGDELAKREAAMACGEDVTQPIDWETAKQSLKKDLL